MLIKAHMCSFPILIISWYMFSFVYSSIREPKRLHNRYYWLEVLSPLKSSKVISLLTGWLLQHIRSIIMQPQALYAVICNQLLCLKWIYVETWPKRMYICTRLKTAMKLAVSKVANHLSGILHQPNNATQSLPLVPRRVIVLILLTWALRSCSELSYLIIFMQDLRLRCPFLHSSFITFSTNYW